MLLLWLGGQLLLLQQLSAVMLVHHHGSFCACCCLFPLTSKDHKVIIWQAGRPLAQLPHLQATRSLSSSCLGSTCLPHVQASQNACNSAHQLPIGPPAAHHHGCCTL